jgi:hypothetical protein
MLEAPMAGSWRLSPYRNSSTGILPTTFLNRGVEHCREMANGAELLDP